MGVMKKGRRKITVRDKLYIWFIEPDDGGLLSLNILSDCKTIVLSCPLSSGATYVIAKGALFQGRKTNGLWHRYPLPFPIPEAITPKFVSDIILWATEGDHAEEISWDGKPL